MRSRCPIRRVMIYTSGPLAHPKGCVHSHATIARQAFATGEVMALSADDRLWDPLPVLSHWGNHPMVAAIQAPCFLPHGGTLRARPGAASSGERGGDPGLHRVPHADQQPRRAPGLPVDRSRRAALAARHRTSAALHRVQQALPRVVQAAGYGATELGGVVTYSRIGDTPESRATTCGRNRCPGPRSGSVIPTAGWSGLESSVRSRCADRSRILGYYRDEGELPVSQDGWLKTGDLAP